MQPLPNIEAMAEYNDSSPDNLSLGNRLRHWRSSGSFWTLYISILPLTLHHWYLTIPPSIDNNHLHNRPVPSPNHRTTLHLPRPTQSNHNSPALKGYLATASSSKQRSSQPIAQHSTPPIPAIYLNNPYLPQPTQPRAAPKRPRTLPPNPPHSRNTKLTPPPLPSYHPMTPVLTQCHPPNPTRQIPRKSPMMTTTTSHHHSSPTTTLTRKQRTPNHRHQPLRPQQLLPNHGAPAAISVIRKKISNMETHNP